MTICCRDGLLRRGKIKKFRIDVAAMIGVNPDRRESDLAPMSQDLLDLWSGSSGGGQETALAPSNERQTQPLSLWWYVMLLALLAAMTETGLASRYMSTLREEP